MSAVERETETGLRFDSLVRAMGSPDKVALRTRLGISERVMNRYSTYGLDELEARRCARAADLDPSTVWPILLEHAEALTPPQSGATTAGSGSTPTPIALEFRDPPRRGPKRDPLISVRLEALKAHPGRWAVIAAYDKKTSAGSAATRFKKDGTGSGFELRAGTTATGGSELFARFPAPEA